MMKRVLSGVMIAAMLLASAVFFLPLSTPVEAATAGDENLYVEDGLVFSLSALDFSLSEIDLAAGTWKDPKSGFSATLAGGAYSAENPTGWKFDGDKGLSYAFTSMQDYTANSGKVGLILPKEALSDGNFSFEMVMRPDYIRDASGKLVAHNNENGTSKWGAYSGSRSTLALAGYQWCTFQPSVYNNGTADQPQYTGASMTVRQFYYRASWSGDSGVVGAQDKTANENFYPFGTYGYNKEGVLADKIVRDVTFLSVDRSVSDGEQYKKVEFKVKVGAVSSLLTNGDGKKLTDGSSNFQNNFYTLEDCTRPFEAMFGLPGAVFAVRVYNRTLTEAEHLQNKFADIMAYVELDPADYFALDEEVRPIVHRLVSELGFDTDKKTVKATIAAAKEEYDRLEAEKEAARLEREELLASLENRTKDQYDKYYVQKGMVFFLDGFVSMNEWNEDIDLAAGTWTSKDGSVVATIESGDRWQEAEDGHGIEFRLSKSDFYTYGAGIGISFDVSKLPSTFTVETVAKMVGITDENGNRYVDPESSPNTWGVYTGGYSTFSFGMLKSMSMVCKSLAVNGTDMQNRWCYTSKEWSAHNGSEPHQYDYYPSKLDPNVPTSLVIQHVLVNPALASYDILYDGTSSAGANVTVLVDKEPEFHLFRGYPATVYAIRLYNRTLTSVELAQNRMADLLSYYGLDTEFLDLVLDTVGDLGDGYLYFNDVSFGLTKEEAEDAFRSALVGAWIQYGGFSAKLDKNPAMRVEFEISESGIASLEKAGYKVEVGMLLNLNKTMPRVGSAEYSFLLRDGNGAYQDAFFLSRDADGLSRAGISVNYNCPTPEMAITALSASAYLKLTDENGVASYIYVDADPEGFEANLFSFYRNLIQNGGYGDNAFVKDVVENSYLEKEITVNAQTGDDANGADGAVKTAARAFELLLELLTGETPISVTVRMDAGTYRQTEKVSLDDADISAPYYRLQFIGAEDDGTVISGAKAISGADFVPVDGKDYYMYQFAKDENGEYPDFRNLYVNGSYREIAFHGYNRSYLADVEGGEMFKMTHDGATMEQVADGRYKMYLPEVAFLGLTAADFATGEVEMHVPVAWYYRVIPVESVDFSDVKDGNVAVYFPAGGGGYSNSHNHNFKGCYFWFQDSLGFLDQPGEYFYDDDMGTLYYYPEEGEDLSASTVEYGVAGHLWSFYDVMDLTLENLVFANNENAIFDKGYYQGGQDSSAPGDYGANTLTALYLNNTRGTTLYNCTFRDLATNAVLLHGGTYNARVDSCRFYGIGSTALEIGKHSSEWNDASNANVNVEVVNSDMLDIAWLTRGSVALYISVGKYVEIHQNTIRNTSYSAMSVGWSWGYASWKFGENWRLYQVDIHHNYFSGFMSDQADGGGIYTLGGNVEIDYHDHFNFLHDNFVYVDEVAWDGKGILMPYYHDESSSNWHTYSNVELILPTKKVLAPIYVQNIKQSQIYNVLVESCDLIWAIKPYEMYAAGEEFDDEKLEYTIFGEATNFPRQDSDDYKYYSRVLREKFNDQYNNYIYDNPSDILDWAGWVIDIIDSTGCEYSKPDAEEILTDAQPYFDAYWAEQAEKAE